MELSTNWIADPRTPQWLKMEGYNFFDDFTIEYLLRFLQAIPKTQQKQIRNYDPHLKESPEILVKKMEEQYSRVQEGAPQSYSCVEYGHEVTYPLPEVPKGLEEPNRKAQGVRNPQQPPEALLRQEGKTEQLPRKPEALCRREECTSSVHQQPPEALLRTRQSDLQPQEVQLFPTPDIRCLEKVGGDQQQPVKELLRNGKEPLLQQIQPRAECDSLGCL
ncbi:hypothetical protein EOD39_7262 [Acipenser ruthenus]|uniref:Uncharacterized protein n=1 Tax=Acipenser ruthenus TaxID=7906 RepID=A0A444U7D4_ACIRT|nr:hypothetical protein EOD39_7262 [Acipenser ruthenus]